MSRREQAPGERLERMVTDLKSMGMTYREIGQNAGLSVGTVWRAALGEIRQPPYSTFARIEALHQRRCGGNND